MDALLLLLLDSRSPAGAHAHSTGMEAAIMAGHVHDVADVEAFCRGRLRTTSRVGAAFAATAHRYWLQDADPDAWELLDAEFEARTPSEAGRIASRALGSGLRRLLRSMLPEADLDTPWTLIRRPAPHHPLVLGTAVALAGGDATLAAQATALASITAPASAAVRLLGLDPLAMQGMLARLSPDLAVFSSPESQNALEPDSPPELWALPADSAPALELLAEFHRSSEVRLFAS
jgi:urease accessory protein